MTKHFLLPLAALVGAAFAQPAAAQTRYEFFEAVREGDFAVVDKGIRATGSKMVNARDETDGATPLYIVTEQRKLDWMNYMLIHGANPDIASAGGDRPLHVAAQNDFVEGAKLLLGQGATVDVRGVSGETPLIRAVRLRKPEIVKLLMRRGANPDLSDTATGRSARDYASEDPRGRAMLDAIEQVEREKDPTSPATSDSFDFSGDFLPMD